MRALTTLGQASVQTVLPALMARFMTSSQV